MSGTEGAANLSDCCLSGHLHTGTPKGKVEEIAGFKAYVATPPDGSKKKAVIYLTDVFGYEFKNARLLADVYANAGLHVVMPDFLGDTAMSPDMLKVFEPNLKERETLTAVDKAKNAALSGTSFGPFMVKNRQAVIMPKIEAVVDALKADPAVGKLGAVGFCFGGRYSILLTHGGSKVDAAVSNHPGMLGFPGDVEAVEKPLSIALGDEDTLVPRAQIDQIIEILEKKTDLDKEIVIYPGQIHGFTVRGDPTCEEDKQSMDKAAKQAIEWLNKYLA